MNIIEFGRPLINSLKGEVHVGRQNVFDVKKVFDVNTFVDVVKAFEVETVFETSKNCLTSKNNSRGQKFV